MTTCQLTSSSAFRDYTPTHTSTPFNSTLKLIVQTLSSLTSSPWEKNIFRSFESRSFHSSYTIYSLTLQLTPFSSYTWASTITDTSSSIDHICFDWHFSSFQCLNFLWMFNFFPDFHFNWSNVTSSSVSHSSCCCQNFKTVPLFAAFNCQFSVWLKWPTSSIHQKLPMGPSIKLIKNLTPDNSLFVITTIFP